MLNISEPIKARRRELGMTQEQLAQQLGVSGPAVSKWEQGASYPDVTLLPALARALHTDLNTLMGFRRMPEKAEITQMLARVNDVVREQGVDAGVALAKEILREYPDCGALLFGASDLKKAVPRSGLFSNPIDSSIFCVIAPRLLPESAIDRYPCRFRSFPSAARACRSRQSCRYPKRQCGPLP